MLTNTKPIGNKMIKISTNLDSEAYSSVFAASINNCRISSSWKEMVCNHMKLSQSLVAWKGKILTLFALLESTLSIIAVININNGTLLISLPYSFIGDASTQSNNRKGSAANRNGLSSKNFSGKGKLHKNITAQIINRTHYKHL